MTVCWNERCMYMSTFKSLGAEWVVDSGHAWLKVDLRMHPRALECGTGYGYIDTKKQVIYLEEDVEAGNYCRLSAPVYMNVLADRISNVQYVGDAPCRSLPHNSDSWVEPDESA